MLYLYIFYMSMSYTSCRILSLFLSTIILIILNRNFHIFLPAWPYVHQQYLKAVALKIRVFMIIRLFITPDSYHHKFQRKVKITTCQILALSIWRLFTLLSIEIYCKFLKITCIKANDLWFLSEINSSFNNYESTIHKIVLKIWFKKSASKLFHNYFYVW